MSIPTERLNQVSDEAAQKISPEENLRQANINASVLLQEAASLIDGGSQKAVDLRGRIDELQNAKAQLGQASPIMVQAELASQAIEKRWLDQVSNDASALNLYIGSHHALVETRASEETELTRLQSARFGSLRFRHQIQTTQNVLRKLEEYERKYQEEVMPSKVTVQALTTQFAEIKGRSDEIIETTTTQVIERVGLTIDQMKQKAAEAMTDPAWRTQADQEYLQTHLEPALQEAIKGKEIPLEKAKEIRDFITHYFSKGVPAANPYWDLPKEEADKIRTQREQYEQAYKKLHYKVENFCRMVGLDGPLQPQARLYDHLSEVMVDFIASGEIEQASKVSALFDGGYNRDRSLFEARIYNLQKRLQYSGNPHQFDNIQGLDRWKLVAKRLIERGVVTEEEAASAEERLIWELTNQALIPGGHESWAGSRATVQLADLGNPKGLEAILLYQGLTAGPAGLYPAGHTNNAADYARERLMAGMSSADIEALDSPRFIKRVLLAFKDPDQSDLVSKEYKQAWGQLDGYARARLTAELFGREFKEILEEMKTNPAIDKRWLTVALRGVGAIIGELSESDYSLLSQMAIADGNIRTEILRMLCNRVKGISVALAHHEQVDADLVAQAVLEIINHNEYKPNDEDLIALFKACSHLGVKLKLPTFPKADRDQAAVRAEQIGDKLAGWIEDGELSERQILIALQALDVLENSKYAPILLKESSRLLLQAGLEQKYSQENGQIYGRYRDKIIMLKNWNRHSVYETLADIVLRTDFILKYRPAGENAMIEAFKMNPDAREGISKVYKDGTNDNEMNTDPNRKEDYISEYINLLVLCEEASEGSKLILETLEWRIDFLKCQTSTDLVAETIKGKNFGSKLLSVVAELTTKYYAIEQRDRLEEGKKMIRKKLAESCEGYLTSGNNLDKLYAVLSLATIEWESDEMHQAIKDLLETQEIVKDGKKPAELPEFMEVYARYITTPNIAILKKAFPMRGESEPVDEELISKAIIKLFHRREKGSTVDDYTLLTKLVENPAELPSAVDTLFSLLSRSPQAPFFYGGLIVGSLFERVNDVVIRQPLLETARRIVDPHFLEAYGGRVNIQLDVIRRLINGLKEGRQAQRVTPEQQTEVVNIIKSNDSLYRQALRSLNA